MNPAELAALRKVRQVFTFLKALDEHRNPVKRQIADQPWRMSLSQLPDHPDVELVYPVDDDRAEGDTATRSGGHILRVRRPLLSRPPEPPAAHREWVLSGWEDPSSEVRFLEQSPVSPDGVRQAEKAIGEAFEADQARVEALAAWQVARDRWAAKERPARRAMELFERLYGLQGTLARVGDEMELVFGDAMLNWRVSSGGIHHPVMLQRAELHFDPDRPEFIVTEAETPVELYTAVLRNVQGLDGRVLATLRQELEAGDVSPLQGHAAGAYMRGMAARLSGRGEYLEVPPGTGEEDWPRVWREPILFVRRRSLGFASAIEAILEDLSQREDVSPALGRIVGFEVEQDHVPLDPSQGRPPWSEPEEILLSRAANPEQIRVAERLSRSSSVVVQGPPGTGKTHTIANLIGHLLAQGKSVLVTSHTAKALTVLREKVVEDLRPLCISVLGDDVDSRRQLEHSVNGMVERLSSANPADLDSRAHALAGRRSQLIREIEALRQRVIESRKGEYAPITIGGRSIQPAHAAREIADQRQESDWLPGPVKPGASLPLAPEEVAELYLSNELLSAQDEAQLARQVPDRSHLPNPANILAFSDHHTFTAQQDRIFGAKFWNRPAKEEDSSAFLEAAQVMADATARLTTAEQWWLRLVEIALRGEGQVVPWQRLLEEIDSLSALTEVSAEPRFRYGPKLPDVPLDEQVQTVEEILTHLKGGGRLSWVNKVAKPSWRRFISGARIRNSPPSRVEHFEALHAQIVAALRGRQVAERWQRMAEPLGLPAVEASEPNLDRKLNELGRAIQSALSWPGIVWGPAQKILDGVGFRWELFTAEDGPRLSETPQLDRVRRQLEQLPAILQARRHAARWAYLERHRRALQAAASRLQSMTPPADVTTRLARTLDTLDTSGYEVAYRELERLEGLVQVGDRRTRLLERIEAVAPRWAEQVRLRSGVHGGPSLPGTSARAWEWRQIEEELERRGQESLSDLQQAIQARSDDLRRITTRLIEYLAWAAQCRRINLETRQALIGWQDIVRRTPKTSSIPGRLARLRRAAQEAMRRCRKAVPVWIMPLSRVVENFDFAQARFDVVVIDEASQTDVMGLLVYYIAEKVLVVGDHEQVSPSAVGQKEEIVQQLIREHLQGIPNADLYDGKTSIYDLARQSSEGATCLVEHFRCASEIIQFSNDLCYDGTIKPLRDPSGVRVAPHVIPYRVMGPFDKRRHKINPSEAEIIASIVAACVEQPEFSGLSMGIISMVGDEQAVEIDRLLQAHVPPADYKQHQIVCGSSAQFQGDERDVMFLSIVDSPEEGPLRMRQEPMFRQRFNVAASRARDQAWVVYSLDPGTDLQPGDLRRRLIEHAIAPQALVQKLDQVNIQTESELERLVARRLVDRGYRVLPQYRVGYYRIDLVVEGRGRKLAVECDGDRFHPPEKLGEDMARQATLERLGWTFVRVRGTQFFRDPERAMKTIFEALDRLQILPEGEVPEDQRAPLTSALDHELVQRVVRRAAELRRAWSGGGSSDDDPTAKDGDKAGQNKEPATGGDSMVGAAMLDFPGGEPRPPNSGAEEPARSGKILGFSRTQDRPETSMAAGEFRTLGGIQTAPKIAADSSEHDLPGSAGEEDYRSQLPEQRGNVWLALSHWAKVNNRFTGWERGILYSVGIYLRQRWRLTAKQANHAKRLFRSALEAGFDPDAPGDQAEISFDRKGPTDDQGKWQTIEEVPQANVQQAILSSVPAHGEPIEREVLLRSAMRQLGFQRLKRRIRSRLNRGIGGFVRAGRLGTDGNAVWLLRSPTAGSSDNS